MHYPVARVVCIGVTLSQVLFNIHITHALERVIVSAQDFCNLLPSPGSNRQKPYNPQKDSLEEFHHTLKDLVGLSQCSIQRKVLWKLPSLCNG
jgi:hypothetical protein